MMLVCFTAIQICKLSSVKCEIVRTLLAGLGSFSLVCFLSIDRRQTLSSMKYDREAMLVNMPAAIDSGRNEGERLRHGEIAPPATTPQDGNNDEASSSRSSDKIDGADNLDDVDEETKAQARRPRRHRWDAVQTDFKAAPRDIEHDHTHRQHLPSWLSRFFSAFLSLPIISAIARYLSGPSDVNRRRQPRLWRLPVLDTFIEPHLVRWTRWARRPELLYVFLLAWLLGFTFLARAAWYNSSTGDNGTDSWISGTAAYWGRNDACGLNGASCGPFEGYTASYRCPSRVASDRLLNYRTSVDPDCRSRAQAYRIYSDYAALGRNKSSLNLW